MALSETVTRDEANVAPDAMKLVTELEKADAQAATDAARAAIGLALRDVGS